MISKHEFPVRSIGQLILLGLRCKCPQCGTGRIFVKYLKIANRCSSCGLNLEGHDTGDGAVVPAMLLIGTLVVGLAAYVEFTFEPPLWVHAVLWVPVVFGLTMMVLPPLKGITIALQHRYRSTEEISKPGR